MPSLLGLAIVRVPSVKFAVRLVSGGGRNTLLCVRSVQDVWIDLRVFHIPALVRCMKTNVYMAFHPTASVPIPDSTPSRFEVRVVRFGGGTLLFRLCDLCLIPGACIAGAVAFHHTEAALCFDPLSRNAARVLGTRLLQLTLLSLDIWSVYSYCIRNDPIVRGQRGFDFFFQWCKGLRLHEGSSPSVACPSCPVVGCVCVSPAVDHARGVPKLHRALYRPQAAHDHLL